jgi:hypothetical protein
LNNNRDNEAFYDICLCFKKKIHKNINYNCILKVI